MTIQYNKQVHGYMYILVNLIVHCVTNHEWNIQLTQARLKTFKTNLDFFSEMFLNALFRRICMVPDRFL